MTMGCKPMLESKGHKYHLVMLSAGWSAMLKVATASVVKSPVGRVTAYILVFMNAFLPNGTASDFCGGSP